MPMGDDVEDIFYDSWDTKEQLYMMEVIVDSVKVEEDRAHIPPNSALPMSVKIQFADFPVMVVENNELILLENLEAEDSSCLTIENKIIKGVPDEWVVKQAGPSYYSVEIPLIPRPSLWNIQESNSVRLLIPRMAVTAGEGLKYIFAALRSRGDEQIFNNIQNQVKQELQRIKDTGESKVVSQHKFSSGKSCLFHMSPQNLLSSLQGHPLRIQVYRSCPDGKELVQTLIGEADIPLGLSFTKAILLANTPVLLPVAAHVEDVFPLKDVFGNQSGSIFLFMRLSCFGASVFQKEEDDDTKKKLFLKNLMVKEQAQYSYDYLDVKYPWKKNLDVIKDRPAPRPRLQPMYDAMPSPPPPPLPPFEMGDFFPDLPRCSPYTPPPCYRRAGDPPLSRCTRAMEEQLRREELTKAAQTETRRANTSSQNQYNYSNTNERQGLMGGYQENVTNPLQGSCTCPVIPPELRPTADTKKNIECTCAAVIKTLGPSNIPPTGETEAKYQHVGKREPIPEPPVLGESDYEITLTKSKCGLEGRKEVENPFKDNSKPVSDIAEMVNTNVQKEKNEKEDVMPEKVKNILKSEILKHKEISEKTQAEGLPNVIKEAEQSVKKIEEKDVEEDEILDHDQMEEYDSKRERKMKKRQIYEQTAGMYPGRHVGHKHCLIPTRRVPKSMGWLWTAVTFDGLLKAGHGWRPGSIRKDVNNMLTNMRTDDSDSDTHTGTQPKQKYRPFSAKSQQTKKNVETVKQYPTLHIHKKEGYVYVSLIPAKVDSEDDTGEEPKPIQFKIDPKHPDGVEDGESCYDLSESSSDVKSYEMDFTAPIALKKRRRVVEKTVMATQYNEQDFIKKTQKKQKNEPEPPPKAPVEEQKKKKSAKGKGKKK